jgi:hypothetical protein
MLKKVTNRISFSLLPIFSAFFIAVGMPLFHPVLHSHSENHDIISQHCAVHISALADEDHEIKCPICDFLATRQLYDSGMAPIITEIQPIGNIISIKNVFLAKIGLSQTEPRAPPVFTSL